MSSEGSKVHSEVKENNTEENTADEAVNSVSFNTKPYLIGIAGGSASGKTSVAQVIFKLIGIKDCVLISTDSYYKQIPEEEYKNLSEYNFDHPNAFDWDLFVEQLNQLTHGKPIEMPVYNFTVSRREKFTQTIKPCHLIIVEGILGLYDKRVRNMMDMKIFVDTDSDVRLARRIYRDIKERGRNLESVIFRYHKFVKPCFEEYIKPTRKLADVIIPRGAENTVAIDLVAQHLKFQLTKIFSTSKQVDDKGLSIKSESSVLITINDIIDPKYQFYEGRVIVNEDSSHVETLQHIFQDFINGKNFAYSSMFLDFLANNLLSQYSKFIKNKTEQSDLIITELDDWRNLKVDISGIKRIIYYQTSLLVESDFTNLENLIKAYPTKEIHVLSIYLSPKFTDIFLANLTTNKLNTSVTFITLFFNDSQIKYYKYIICGGNLNMPIEDDEGDFTSQLNVFKKESFVDYIRNLWSSHL